MTGNQLERALPVTQPFCSANIPRAGSLAWRGGVTEGAAIRALGLLAIVASSGLGCAEAEPVRAPDRSGDEATNQVEPAGEASSALSAVPVCLSFRRGVQGDAFDTMLNREPAGAALNYGALSLLSAGTPGAAAHQVLVRWDLSTIPQNAQLLSAAIYLSLSSTGPGTLVAHPALAPWDEHQVSWNSFGGAFGAAALAQLNNGYPGAPTLSFDALPIASGWVSGSVPNHGILLDQAAAAFTRVKSSEWPSAVQRPTLNVCYRIPCAAGHADCDFDGKNGCETSIDTSIENCGACGVHCQGAASCVAGACVAPACAGKVAFHPGPVLRGGAAPSSVVAADLDGDGRPDLAATSWNSANLRVFFSSPNGTFPAKMDLATGAIPYSIAAGDLDGDGRPDLAVANSGSHTVSVLLATGGGGFAPQVQYPIGLNPHAVAIADLNGDGKLDLAIACQDSNAVSVLFNQGFGVFGGRVDLTTGLHPFSLSAADLSGDGLPDLAVADAEESTVSVLINTGNGTFAPRVAYASGKKPFFVTAADLDGDGDRDLALANFDGHSVSVLVNHGNGTFAPKVDYPVGLYPLSIAVADLDGDGRADLSVASEVSNTVSVLFNQGNGAFAPKVDFAAGLNPLSVTAVDLNQDGRLDLAVANGGDDTVSVLLASCTAPLCTGMLSLAGLPLRDEIHPWFGALGSGDVTGDGRPDLVAYHHIFGGLLVLPGKGDGTFDEPVYSSAPSSCNPTSMTAFQGALGARRLAVVQDCDDTLRVLNAEGGGALLFDAEYPTGASPSSVTAADLNGDGLADLLVTNAGEASVSVRLAWAEGAFPFRSDYPTGADPRGATAVDLNGDGALDLAVASAGLGVVSVRLGNGDGTFGGRIDYPTGAQPASVASADLDGDGRPELILAGAAVSVLHNDGNGAFPSRVDYPLAFGASLLSAVDRNGDGRADLFTAGPAGASVLLNPGNGTFPTRVDYPGSAGSSTIVELNGDGRPDLATVLDDVAIRVQLGEAGGRLVSKVAYPAGATQSEPVAADLNGDGRVDLIGEGLRVMLNLGQGAFAPAITYAAPGRPLVADLNGDGRPDLVAVDGNGVSVLLNHGDGTFPAKVVYPVSGSGPAAAADLDADGRIDLALLAGDTVQFLHNLGDGSFAPPIGSPAHPSSTALVAVDLNGDGRADLATANSGAATVSVMFNNGNGTFAPGVEYGVATGYSPNLVAIAAGDFNGDGHADLVVADGGEDAITILTNLGDGTLVRDWDFTMNRGYWDYYYVHPTSLTTGDLDGDGQPDIIAGSAAGRVSVMLSSGNGAPGGRRDYFGGGMSVVAADLDGDGRPDLAQENGWLPGRCAP
jgi:hypothetical protein